MLTSHRVCPGCDGLFEVDSQTKRRQAAFIVLALAALALTILMYFDFRRWAALAIPACVVLGAMIYFANKKVYLVKAERTARKSEES